MATRTVKDESLKEVADAIRTKAGSHALEMNFPQGFSYAISKLRTNKAILSERDINFWDIDGTLLYSYSLNDIQKMETLPEAPFSPYYRLTFSGWNWSLDALKKYNKPVDVGAIYNVADDATMIFVEINARTAETVTIHLSLQEPGLVMVDWGDGMIDSIEFEAAGAKTASHDYASGNFAIILRHTSKKPIILGANDGTNTLLGPNTVNTQSALATVVGLFLGSKDILGQYALDGFTSLEWVSIAEGATVGTNTAEMRNCRNLRHINLPKSVKRLENMQFQYCTSLARVAAGEDMGESLNANAFGYCQALRRTVATPKAKEIKYGQYYYCYSLRTVIIDEGISSIGGSAFSTCRAVSELEIPESVTNLAAGAFTVMNGLRRVRFLSQTPPIVANPNAFNGWPTSCVVEVPAGSLEAYQNDENYGGIVAQMVEV